MPNDLVRSIMKAIIYKFCHEIFAIILLFDCSICPSLLQNIAWWCEKNLCGINRLKDPGNRVPSHYPKCILVSKGKISPLFKPIRNYQSHTAMLVWFSMVDYLQTLKNYIYIWSECFPWWYIALVRWPPCELNISCTWTTAESRAKIWYQ